MSLSYENESKTVILIVLTYWLVAAAVIMSIKVNLVILDAIDIYVVHERVKRREIC